MLVPLKSHLVFAFYVLLRIYIIIKRRQLNGIILARGFLDDAKSPKIGSSVVLYDLWPLLDWWANMISIIFNWILLRNTQLNQIQENIDGILLAQILTVMKKVNVVPIFRPKCVEWQYFRKFSKILLTCKLQRSQDSFYICH